MDRSIRFIRCQYGLSSSVFVVFHNPVYNRSGFEPIPEDTNPHATLASYAKDFAELVVFNGH
ncbi:hypothetical protein ACC685_38750, partial [Rhizobium ruizarguesonis]